MKQAAEFVEDHLLGPNYTGYPAAVTTWLANPTSANLYSAMVDKTGTGLLVFNDTPTLIAPLLGTPTSGNLANCTGLPISGGTTGTLPINRGGTGSTTQNFVDLTTAQTVAGVKNFTSDVKGLTFNANNSAPPSATAPSFFYVYAPGSYDTGTCGLQVGIRNSKDTTNGLYGVNATVTQTAAASGANGVLYGGKFQAEALASVQTAYGFFSVYTVGASAVVQDGGSTLVQINHSGQTVNLRGLYLNLINNANISGSLIANYVKYQHQNAASTLPAFTAMKVELVNGTQTITTAKGIAFEGYANSGTITTNYLIYADTNSAQGTTKYGLYFLPDMPSYHVGKFGLGSGITTPTARLHIAAGSATANTAPLKFNSGTLLTTPEAGAHEFLTDDFFLTISTGPARKGIVLDDGARLTSGKIPRATTNGRLIDGPTPLSGTKVYYVSDSSGGAVTRKLTFTDGILTSET